MRFTFPKEEKLCSRIKMDLLFSKGKSINASPFKFIYVIGESEENTAAVQVLISVPKRRIRKAVHRNRIKRLIRESYRLNKSELLQKTASEDKNIMLAIVYYGGLDINFEMTQEKILYLLGQMATILNKKREEGLNKD